MRDLLRHPTGMVGATLLAIVMVAVVVGPILAPYDPQQFHPAVRLRGPSAAHWLGTDQFGRDILSRILHGARATILFGVGATLAGVAAGTLIGVVAGVAGRWIDSVIMRLLDGLLAVPDRGGGTGHAMLAVAVAFTPGMARIARAAVLSVRTREFVQAAQARGESPVYVIGAEVLPNTMGPVIVEATIRVSFAIMLGATLGFLGLGAQPPSTEWGLMIAEARQFMFRNPWCVAAPGIAIAVAALGFNLFGDALRDVLDPRGRQR
jgi:peptide/nickel transport system permease protein